MKKNEVKQKATNILA